MRWTSSCPVPRPNQIEARGKLRLARTNRRSRRPSRASPRPRGSCAAARGGRRPPGRAPSHARAGRADRPIPGQRSPAAVNRAKPRSAEAASSETWSPTIRVVASALATGKGPNCPPVTAAWPPIARRGKTPAIAPAAVTRPRIGYAKPAAGKNVPRSTPPAVTSAAMCACRKAAMGPPRAGTIDPTACRLPAGPTTVRSAAIARRRAIDHCPVTDPKGKRRTRASVRASRPELVVRRPSFVKLKPSAPLPASISLWSK